jgi:hypothetical protein
MTYNRTALGNWAKWRAKHDPKVADLLKRLSEMSRKDRDGSAGEAIYAQLQMMRQHYNSKGKKKGFTEYYPSSKNTGVDVNPNGDKKPPPTETYATPEKDGEVAPENKDKWGENLANLLTGMKKEMGRRYVKPQAKAPSDRLGSKNVSLSLLSASNTRKRKEIRHKGKDLDRLRKELTDLRQRARDARMKRSGPAHTAYRSRVETIRRQISQIVGRQRRDVDDYGKGIEAKRHEVAK